MNVSTEVKITIDGKSVSVPLAFFAAALTSHSLALTEWAETYKTQLCDKIDEYTETDEAVNAVKAYCNLIEDVRGRRKHIQNIENLWK